MNSYLATEENYGKVALGMGKVLQRFFDEHRNLLKMLSAS